MVTQDTRTVKQTEETLAPVETSARDHLQGSSYKPFSSRQNETWSSIETSAAMMLMDEISKDMPEMTNVVIDCKFLVDLNHKAMIAIK